ncbi:hypothetical protein L1F30_16280 [Simiduia sp. 21SJ11W-1]|uniref:hypothetical protein n=1 Tax=Simiduia sp. 21SJ11W-1 TaxID=2909669 RepID=UPI0020A1F438|nr:hypothetical protein [Simiduia sp. 21SJ11W-1]UTA47700.1 hypothetical protein L1F30_16280 [Simiduia sp. 21SJ11W-1]
MTRLHRNLLFTLACLAAIAAIAATATYLLAPSAPDPQPAASASANALQAEGVFAAKARPVITLSATNYLGKQTYTNHPITQRVANALDTLGYDIQIMHNPGLRSLAMANSGVVDGELIRIRAVGTEYPNLLVVPVPLVVAGVGLYTHKRHPQVSKRSWHNFNAERFAAVKGMMLLEKLPPQFAHTPVIYAQGYQQAVHQVIAGRADLTLLPTSYVDRLLDKSEAAELVLLQPPLPPAEGFLHLHKRHEGLIQPLTRLLQEQSMQQNTSSIARSHAR